MPLRVQPFLGAALFLAPLLAVATSARARADAPADGATASPEPTTTSERVRVDAESEDAVAGEDPTDSPARGPGVGAGAASRVATPYRARAHVADPEVPLPRGGSSHRVDEAQLRALGHFDIERVAARIPGVTVRSEDGYGLRPNIGMRGANSHRGRRVTLLEDGVPQAYAPYASPSVFSMTPMSRVVGVDAFRGPAAILYGPQTLAGALDLRTRQVPEGEEAVADVLYGSNHFLRLRAHAGASSAHFGALAEGAYMRASGFQTIDVDGGSNDFDLGDVMLRAFYRDRIGDALRHRLSTKAVLQFERSNQSYVGLTDDDYRADPDRRYAATALDEMTRLRQQLEVRHDLRAGRALSLTTVAYRSDTSRTWYRLDAFRTGPKIDAVLREPTDPERAPFYALLTGQADHTDPSRALLYVSNDWRYLAHGVQADAVLAARSGPVGHQVRVGARIHEDWIDRDVWFDGWLMRGGRLVRDGQPRTPSFDDRASAFALAAYARYEVAAFGASLAPGLRVERIASRFVDRQRQTRVDATTVLLTPGVSTTMRVAPCTEVFAGVHLGASPPLPQDAATTRPERATNYEAGIRYAAPDRTIHAETTAYVSNYTQLTSQCTLTAGCVDLDRGYNVGRALVWGVEAAVQYEPRLGRFLLPIALTYTLTRSSLRSAFDSADPQLGRVEAGDELPYVPEHQGSLAVGMSQAERFSVTASMTHVGPMREEASRGDEGRRTDAQWMLDVAGEVRLTPAVSVMVRGENLLDQRPIVSRRPWGARPARPLQLQVGLRVSW
jgi:Fe(3+) dicitrate transport protein